jgi:adhesin transport system outer membrane protein
MSPDSVHRRRRVVAAVMLAAAVANAGAARPAARAVASPATVAQATAPAPAPTQTRCVDEETFDTGRQAASASPLPAADPRLQLNEMVREALGRSQSLGAAQLIAEAALSDIDEARAAKSVQASVNASIGPGVSQSGGVTETAAVQARAGISVSQLVFDGGRSDSLTGWRVQLAESARFGQLSQQEQLAVSTVALALERSRYRMQVQVYGQYTRKMGCLVDALETIVRSDRGRASELVQAKKSHQQAELAMTQAQSQMRQVEVRLRRLVGDGLPGTNGLATVLLQVPELERLQADVEQAPDIAQIGAQAAAAEKYAQAVAAQTKPQVSWLFNGGKNMAAGGNVPSGSGSKSGNLSLGIAVNIPLMNPGNAAASDAARKRAQAAALQRADAIDSRKWRVAEVYEQTQSAFDRARRTAATLRDSDQVRNFTLQQWQQLGRRSLFDVMSAESEHYNLRVAYVNAIHDGQQLNAVLLSLGRGVGEWLR